MLMLRRCLRASWRWVGGLGLAWSAGSAALAAEPLPLEHFFQNPAVLQAKLSPSGQQLALTASRGGGQRVRLVVLNLRDGFRPSVAANLADADVRDFHWVNEGRLLFSVVDLQEGSGEDRRLAPGLYAVKPDGSELRQLVKHRGRAVVARAEVRDRSLEWNHQLLRVPGPQAGVDPDEVVMGALNFGDRRLDSVTPLWLNVRTGRTRSLALDGPGHVERWLFDSRGEPRVAMALHEGRQSIHWRGPGETAWRLLGEGAVLKLPFSPLAVDDAGQLYVRYREGPQGYTVVGRYDLAAGTLPRQPMVRAPGFDADAQPVMDPDNGRLLGLRVDTDAEMTVWLDPALKQMQALADERLPGRVNRLSCARCGQPDMVVLVRSYSDQDPGRLWLYRADTRRWEGIAAVMEGVDPRRMATVELERIRARDGRDLPVWLTRPPGLAPGQAAPAVVLVHGGPWVRGGHWAWQPMAQFLASRGYLVIEPEFRGSTGYGLAHFRAGWKQWGQAMQDDVADALLWARAQGLADPQRACIAGGSYGGYSALMGLVRHPELYRCGAAWAAVTDPLLMLQGSWWVDDDTGAVARQYTLPQMVGDTDQDREMLLAASPLAQAARIQAPLLLAMGEADLRVPLAHGERLRAALRAAGRPPEWVSYENEGHSWRLQATRLDFARRLERFLAQHLQ
jgi:acetyl esterase/lipase